LQSFSLSLTDSDSRALAVRQFPRVVAEIKLAQVPMQMMFPYLMVRSIGMKAFEWSKERSVRVRSGSILVSVNW
jgi:hypothetical protein